MSTPFLLPGSSIPAVEVLSPEINQAQNYNQQLEIAARALRISTMRIAYYSHRMRMCQGWIAFGHEEGPRGEEAYRDALGIPRSSWYKAARIGQNLFNLSLEEMERIPVTNAEILLSVSPTIWHDHNWVFEAKHLEPDKLAALVTARNKDSGSPREPIVTMVFHLPMLAKGAVLRMIEGFRKKYELSSNGQALEMLVADRHDRMNLMAATDKARKLVSGSLAKLKRSQSKRLNMADEISWLTLALEVMNEAYEKEVQAARSETEYGETAGGRA